MRSSAARAYSLLFFLSGATGLIYELLWVRLLYQAFGSTIQSVTTVVAAYMGGLGLGAWLWGRRADRHVAARGGKRRQRSAAVRPRRRGAADSDEPDGRYLACPHAGVRGYRPRAAPTGVGPA